MPSKIHSKRKVGSAIYTTELVSSHQAREVYGLSNKCYFFNYLETSVVESGRFLDMCGKSTERRENGQLPLFVMSGVIQVLQGGYAPNIRGECKYCKVVYQVIFCRFGGLNYPTNSTFADTLTAGDQLSTGYKTMREAVDAAREEMINHFYAIRGVRGKTMRWNSACGVEEYILKPFVKPIPAELVAAVAQVDAALATSPVDTDKYAAAVRRLEADCNALTAIHNASKPFVTSVAAPVPCTNTVLSKSASAAVDKASAEIKAANAVLSDATWEDLKNLEHIHYQDCCDKLRQDAAKEIKDVEKRLRVRLKHEEEHHWRVVDQVCDRSKTVEDRLTYLQYLYGKNVTIVGKRLDVYT